MATSLRREQVHDIWYQSSSDPRGLSERVMDTDSDHQRTIIITVYDVRYPITEDVLHKVFDPYGKVELIRILPTTKHFQATVRFQNHDSIKSAKICLQGRNIYDGCCKLDLQYLATSFWDCESSKENAVGSMYSDIYELMKEMSSTIDNLISQLDKYKTTAAEKERKNIELQVFDKLPMKQFMEFSAAEVDSNKFQPTLMKETVAKDTKSSNEDEKETSKVECEISNENVKRSGTALDKLENASEESFLGLGLKVFNISVESFISGAWQALGTAWKGFDGRSGELKKLHDSGIRKASELADCLASALAELASNDIIQRTSGRLDSLHTNGISYLVYVSATNLIRVLFDPGGYIVDTWKMSIPLDFGCVMVEVSDLFINSFGGLMVSWMHMIGFLKFGDGSSKIISWVNSYCGALVDIKCLIVQCYMEESHTLRLFLVSYGPDYDVLVIKKFLGKQYPYRPQGGLMFLSSMCSIYKLQNKGPMVMECFCFYSSLFDVACGKCTSGIKRALDKLLDDKDDDNYIEKATCDVYLIIYVISGKKNDSADDVERCLVYEYYSSGNLAQYLLGKETVLTWELRINILMDCAFALKYLHNHVRGCIVHTGTKLESILLTCDMQPKLSDIRQMLGREESKVFTDVRGTIGCMDRQCMSNAKLTSASDFYSFGIVTLQLLFGQGVIDLDLDARDQLNRKAEDVNIGKRHFQVLRMKGEFECTDTIGYGSCSLSCKEKLQAIIELSYFHPSGALDETLWEQQLLGRAFYLLRLDTVELGIELDPRGRGLVDPGGNVMTPSYYIMKLEFSSDNYFISIWSSKL